VTTVRIRHNKTSIRVENSSAGGAHTGGRRGALAGTRTAPTVHRMHTTPPDTGSGVRDVAAPSIAVIVTALCDLVSHASSAYDRNPILRTPIAHTIRNLRNITGDTDGEAGAAVEDAIDTLTALETAVSVAVQLVGTLTTITDPVTHADIQLLDALLTDPDPDIQTHGSDLAAAAITAITCSVTGEAHDDASWAYAWSAVAALARHNPDRLAVFSIDDLIRIGGVGSDQHETALYNTMRTLAQDLQPAGTALFAATAATLTPA
jgi:hypothetical protein